MHATSCFATLTYRTETLPYGGSLYYRDFQLFMKRLRKQYPGARFFMAGEYGEQTQRPHFHACLFGVDFTDRYPWRVSPAGFDLYRSPTLERLWTANGDTQPIGACEIGELTFESAAYVARYCVKKVTGKPAEEHYRRMVVETGELIDLQPEFGKMSLKPGIGASWLEKYKTDVYPSDVVYVGTMANRPPRYYDKKLSSREISELEAQRFERAQSCAQDSSPDRLRAREIVTRARLSYKRRGL